MIRAGQELFNQVMSAREKNSGRLTDRERDNLQISIAASLLSIAKSLDPSND